MLTALLTAWLLVLVAWVVLMFRQPQRARGGVVRSVSPNDGHVRLVLSEGGPVQSREQAESLGLGQAWDQLHGNANNAPV